MKKPKTLAPSLACACKCLYALLQYMKKNGGSIAYKEIRNFLVNNVELSDWEKERAGKMQYERFWAHTQFYSVDYYKAGFIVKNEGVWYLTPEGDEAMKAGPEAMLEKAREAYKKWKADRDASSETPSSSSDEEEGESTLNLEDLESQAAEGIKAAIANKNPYEFQDMVAALLRAMGYTTPFIAPKGKDGGIDIIGYLDPLGAKTPRLKVQVKHKPDTAVPSKDIQALRGTMSAGDVGVFVTSGTYSADAKKLANVDNKFIRMVDGAEFVHMWEAFYDKMSDEDKNMLPLRRIAFLGTND